MRKKNTAQDIEDMKQIIREFPGTVEKKIDKNGKLYKFAFTNEQLDWLDANYVKRFKCKVVAEDMTKELGLLSKDETAAQILDEIMRRREK